MTGRLHIAMLSVHSCPVGRLGTLDTGGMSVYIMELTRELSRRGHIVDVFTRSHESDHEPVISIGENARLVHLKTGENVVHKLALYPHLQDFACEVEHFRSAHDRQYDAILSHYWLSGITGDILRTWWRVSHLITFHTLAAAKNLAGIGEEEPELRVETERELAGKVDRIVAATEKEKAAMLSFWPVSGEKIGVVPCGVNLDRFKILDRAESRRALGLDASRVLLYVGRIEPAKGIDRLLRAVSLLGKLDLELVIAGGDEFSQQETERLQNLARDLGIESRVRFVGLVEQTGLPVYYSAADVTLVPSYYESFGLVALESMACGTPVIMNRVGGADQIIRDGVNGCTVRNNDPATLAEAITRLFESKIGGRPSAVRRSVSGLGWDRSAAGVMGEIEKAGSGSGLAGKLLKAGSS